MELRECTRNNRQLNIIGVLNIKQRVGEEKAAYVDGPDLEAPCMLWTWSFNPSIWMFIFRVHTDCLLNSSTLFKTLGISSE